MRIDGALVGCQMIAADGTKRFLTGQITKGATLKIDTKGRDIVCEGFATGMSVRRAMRFLKQRYTIHVCFSASNMLEIGCQLRDPLVIADNDAMGVSTAKKIASRYWIGEAGGISTTPSRGSAPSWPPNPCAGFFRIFQLSQP
jgi:putative DNA primase/helicase